MEEKIRVIQRDVSLSNDEKNKRIREVMFSLSQQSPPLPPPPLPEIIKCTHYDRGCLLQCDKCDEFWGCRLCHTEMDRFKVKKVQCKKCYNIQSSDTQTCTKCGDVFGEYFCNVCHLFSNNPDKQIFHCDECGICRIGTRDQFVHCDKCDMCIGILGIETHKCFQNTWTNNCPICFNPLFNSVTPVIPIKCGHAYHVKCLQEYLKHDYRCCVCKKSVVEMNWSRLDNQIGNIESNLIQTATHTLNVLCNDCGHHFQSPFSPFNLYKCVTCGSYNCSK